MTTRFLMLFAAVTMTLSTILPAQAQADAEATMEATITLNFLGGDDSDEEGADGLAEGVDGDDEIRGDDSAWMVYAIGKVSAGLEPEPVEGELSVEPDLEATFGLEGFELERASAELALATFGEAGLKDPDSFWAMIWRAREAGYLDEAVYLHLLDEAMVEDYREYREDHLESLLRYLLDVVVVDRGGESVDG